MKQRRKPPDIERLSALLQGRAPDDVLNLGAVDARPLDRGSDRQRTQAGAGGGIERALVGPPDRRAGHGDDDGVTHCLSS